jgi:outer membrane protein TolC
MQRLHFLLLFLLTLGTCLGQPPATAGAAPASSPAPPSPPTVIFHSVTDVWSAALRNNPTERIYRMKTGQLTEDYKASLGNLLPQASLGISGQDNLKLQVTPVPGELIGQPGKTLYLTFGKQYIYNADLQVSQTIFNWQYVFQSKIAKENVALNSLQQAAWQQNLKVSSAQYYYEGLVASSSLRISGRDLILADSILSTVRDRYTQGLVDISAVHSAEINVNNVRQNIYQSRQLFDQAAQNLKLLTGCKPDQSISLDEYLAIDSLSSASDAETSSLASAAPGTPPDAGTPPGGTSPLPGIPDPARLGQDKNIDVYAGNARLAALQGSLQKTAFYPTLSIAGNLGSQQFRDNFGLTFGNGAWNDYRYLVLNLSVPLFTGFYNRDKYRSAEATARINAQQYQDAIEQGAINDSLLLKTYDNYRLTTEASGRNLLLYRENLILSQRKYEEGLISIDTWQKVFEDYLRSENTHLNNLSQLFSARASIIGRN